MSFLDRCPNCDESPSLCLCTHAEILEAAEIRRRQDRDDRWLPTAQAGSGPPWKVVSPSEYAGADNPYLATAKWIVRSDSRPGESAIVGTEAEALAVPTAIRWKSRGAHRALPEEN